ncbi:RipA family octameric membrane protein [Serratia fonticola]
MDIKEVIDIYKLCVEMADKTSERRLKSNTFIITINTGLISLNSYLSLSGNDQQLWHVALCFVCIIINIYWIFLISTYKKINEAKYAIINKIESDHNLPEKPFTSEYQYLSAQKYYHLSTIEKLIPSTLIFMNIIIMILSIYCYKDKPSTSTTIINIIAERF